MLHTPTPFPHAGSIAYLSPSALKVKIVQHKAHGQVLVNVPEQRCCNPAETAFNSRTVPLADLYPDGGSAAEAAKQRQPAMLADKPKICAECRHYSGSARIENARRVERHRCLRKATLHHDLVTGAVTPSGEFFECRAEREDGPPRCGEAGHFFAPAPPSADDDAR